MTERDYMTEYRGGWFVVSEFDSAGYLFSVRYMAWSEDVTTEDDRAVFESDCIHSFSVALTERNSEYFHEQRT
jgi:hypothetical protein